MKQSNQPTNYTKAELLEAHKAQKQVIADLETKNLQMKVKYNKEIFQSYLMNAGLAIVYILFLIGLVIWNLALRDQIKDIETASRMKYQNIVRVCIHDKTPQACVEKEIKIDDEYYKKD